MTPAGLAAVCAEATGRHRRRIVECGSGFSTLVLGPPPAHAARAPVSLEHDQTWATRVRSKLGRSWASGCGVGGGRWDANRLSSRPPRVYTDPQIAGLPVGSSPRGLAVAEGSARRRPARGAEQSRARSARPVPLRVTKPCCSVILRSPGALLSRSRRRSPTRRSAWLGVGPTLAGRCPLVARRSRSSETVLPAATRGGGGPPPVAVTRGWWRWPYSSVIVNAFVLSGWLERLL